MACKNCKCELNFGEVYCSNKCQQTFQKDNVLNEWKEGKITGLKVGVRLRDPIRNYIWEKFQGKCCLCGWNEINPITKRPPLEIDHIDGNSANCKEENLRLICPNCHSLTPTYKALNKGKANKERLVYSRLITARV